MTTLTAILTHRAESYAARTGFHPDTVFCFLSRIMRERKLKNPRMIHMEIIRNHYLRTTDGDELTPYTPPSRPMICSEAADYWEGRILARQESYWSD